MGYKPNILLVGLHNLSDLESFDEISLFRCQSKQQTIEIIFKHDFELIISKFSLEDGNAVELNDSLQSLKNNYADNFAKNTKLLTVFGASSPSKSNNISPILVLIRAL